MYNLSLSGSHLEIKIEQKHVEDNVQFSLKWLASCLFNTYKYNRPNNYSCKGWVQSKFTFSFVHIFHF